MSKIFISYSNNDFTEVEKIVPFLKEKYHIPFMAPHNIQPGDWDKQIAKEVDACDLFMLFLTESALKSKNVCREVRRMMGRRDLKNHQEHICIFALHTVGELKAMANGSLENQPAEEFSQADLHQLFESHCYTEAIS